MPLPPRLEVVRGLGDLRQGRPLPFPGVVVLDHPAQRLDGDVGIDRGGLQLLEDLFRLLTGKLKLREGKSSQVRGPLVGGLDSWNLA